MSHSLGFVQKDIHNAASERKAVDVLYRISQMSGEERNPKVALARILDEVMDAFEASSASICLFNADSDKLLIEVEKGLSKSSAGLSCLWV